MQYAGIGIRAAATIIDMVVIFAGWYLIASMTGQTTDTGFVLQGGPFFVGVVAAIGYYIALEATLGATLGKLAVRSRVRKADGTPIGWTESIVRNVLRLVDGLVFYILGAIVARLSPTRQRLGDRAAGTVVIRLAAAGEPSATPAAANGPPPTSAPPE